MDLYLYVTQLLGNAEELYEWHKISIRDLICLKFIFVNFEIVDEKKVDLPICDILINVSRLMI